MPKGKARQPIVRWTDPERLRFQAALRVVRKYVPADQPRVFVGEADAAQALAFKPDRWRPRQCLNTLTLEWAIHALKHDPGPDERPLLEELEAIIRANGVPAAGAKPRSNGNGRVHPADPAQQVALLEQAPEPAPAPTPSPEAPTPAAPVEATVAAPPPVAEAPVPVPKEAVKASLERSLQENAEVWRALAEGGPAPEVVDTSASWLAANVPLSRILAALVMQLEKRPRMYEDLAHHQNELEARLARVEVKLEGLDAGQTFTEHRLEAVPEFIAKRDRPNVVVYVLPGQKNLMLARYSQFDGLLVEFIETAKTPETVTPLAEFVLVNGEKVGGPAAEEKLRKALGKKKVITYREGLAGLTKTLALLSSKAKAGQLRVQTDAQKMVTVGGPH